MPDISDSDRQALIDSAQRLQIDPRTLAAVIDYESSFNPRSSSPSGKGYPVRGLIGFDPENVRRYGQPAATIVGQMPQVERYLLDRGWKPGVYAPNDLGRLYSIVNAGGLDKNEQPYWGRADVNGTIAQHVGNISRDHYAAADRFLMPQEDLLQEWLPKKTAPAAARAAPAAEEDLLSEWASPQKAAPAKPAPPVAPASAVASPAPRETLPELMNRLTREHQGDSLSDAGVRAAAGVGRGVGTIGDTLAQGIAWMGEKGAHELAAHGVIAPEKAQAVSDWRQGVLSGITQNRAGYEAARPGTAGRLGEIGGEVLGTAPFIAAGGGALSAVPGAGTAMGAASRLPLVGGIARPAITGAAAGAGSNVLTSSTSDAPLSEQAGAGAIFGAPLGVFGHALGRIVGAGVDRETAQLAQSARDQFGIPVRASQISPNPTVRFMDSVLQRLPFTGLGSHSAEQQLSLQRALAREMGVTSDKITPDVVQAAQRTAYTAYDTAKQSMGTLGTDARFFRDLKDVYDNAHYNLEPKLAKLIDGHLENVVNKVNMGARTLDPDLYQALTRKNGPLDKAISSKDSKISSYAGDIKNALEELVGRNDPGLKALKDAADYKYFVAKSLEPLADEATTGNISPAKLLKAVDYSHTNAGELGRIARRFMVEPPSSGTAERTFVLQHLPQIASGALGVGALGAATAFDPESWQRNMLVGAGALGAGMAGGATLRSKALANAMIRSGLRQSQRPGVLSALPLLAPRTTPWGQEREPLRP